MFIAEILVRDQTWAREIAAKRAASDARGACVTGARIMVHAPAALQTRRIHRERDIRPSVVSVLMLSS
jgi:hypothetical protein